MEANRDLFEQIVTAYKNVTEHPQDDGPYRRASLLVGGAFGDDDGNVKLSLQYLGDACLDDDDDQKEGRTTGEYLFDALNELEPIFREAGVDLSDRLDELQKELAG